MISNPGLVFYACIAKGSIILGEFSSKEPAISETLAQECIDKTPRHHLMFSHTVCKRTYAFLINGPLTYFVIHDEDLHKGESFWFLNQVKSAFEEIFETRSILNFDNVSNHCFQAHFDAVFCEIMGLDLGFSSSSRSGSKDGRSSSVDSSKSRRTVLAPLLGEPCKGLKKKKRSNGESEAMSREFSDVNEEKKVDVCDDVTVQKNALYSGDHRQKAKQIWKKHVWIVLGLDLFATQVALLLQFLTCIVTCNELNCVYLLATVQAPYPYNCLPPALHHRSKFRNLGSSIPIKQLTRGVSETGSLLDGVQLAETLGTAEQEGFI
ncbi:hypothetical protein WN944_014680 [Citrus x changshan-huyou]|uniref:Longin domain-containing protein n=1 Tax=Citrus x changshan-huyou TaxID=2935761 RepID=A0AAP0QLS5_9ROSI